MSRPVTRRPETGRRRSPQLARVFTFTYTKLNKRTHHYYAGRTSMVVDLAVSLEFQAALAVLLRDRNHYLDENAEPGGAMFGFVR